MSKSINTKRDSAGRIAPSISKVKEITDMDITEEPANTFDNIDHPISFMTDAGDIIPHDQVSPKLRISIVSTYGEKFFLEKEWTKGVLARLSRAINNPRENLSNAIAQICSPKCSSKDNCPYDIAGKAPLGERCPLELNYAKTCYKAYAESVAERLDASINEIREDIILHNFVNGLVEADMIEIRLNNMIAHEGFISKSPAAVSETGEVYYKDEESVAIRIKERVERRRSQIYRQLLATPEMAEKYKKKETKDLLARQTKLLDSLEKLVTSNNTNPKEIEALTKE